MLTFIFIALLFIVIMFSDVIVKFTNNIVLLLVTIILLVVSCYSYVNCYNEQYIKSVSVSTKKYSDISFTKDVEYFSYNDTTKSKIYTNRYKANKKNDVCNKFTYLSDDLSKNKLKTDVYVCTVKYLNKRQKEIGVLKLYKFSALGDKMWSDIQLDEIKYVAYKNVTKKNMALRGDVVNACLPDVWGEDYRLIGVVNDIIKDKWVINYCTSANLTVSIVFFVILSFSFCLVFMLSINVIISKFVYFLY